jgi:hypothetical protein
MNRAGHRPRSHPARTIGRSVLVAALIGHALAALVSAALSARPAGDFDRYYEIASSPGRPYVDFAVEHPIATLAVFRSIARLPGGRASFGLSVVALNAIADAIIVFSLWSLWGVAAAACYAVTVLPVIGLFFNRIDAWSTSAAVLAIAAAGRRQSAAAGTALAIGAGFKLWPLVLLPALVLPWRRHRSPAALTAFVVTLGILAGAAALVAGTASAREVLTFRRATGWQIESTIGSLLNLTGAEAPRLESGAYRIGQLTGLTSIGMFVAAAPVSLLIMTRAAQAGLIGAGWLAAVAMLLATSTLFSAQYVIWLTPGAAIALAQGNRSTGGLVALASTLTVVYMVLYDRLIDMSGHAAWTGTVRAIVVARNVVVIALALAAAWLVMRSNHGPPEEEPGREDRLPGGERAGERQQA